MKRLTFGSVCSGINAPSVAWRGFGWHESFAAEIEPFPCAVLAHHFPDVPNRGDMTKFKEWPTDAIDLLVGGTPCQSFSVAGLRKGMDDPRGNLALVFLAIADRLRPLWVVWENVPGVLSSGGGRDFGSFVGGLAQLGYGWSYRILDAQYVRVDGFGRAVPQRRRRVFVVGHLGDWRRAAAVLFERESLCGNSPPSRQTGEGIAGTVTTRTGNGSRQAGEERGNLVAHSLRADGFDASEDGTGRGTPLVAVDYTNGLVGQVAGTLGIAEEHTDCLRADVKSPFAIFQPVPFDTTQVTSKANRSNPRAGDPDVSGDVTHPLGRNHGLECAFQRGPAVRRLTPLECERLQGFPDGYTAVRHRKKPAADGPRYKALGNSMAVPVMRWLGRRILATL